MVQGMISVVVPVYNAEKYLKSSIQSVLNQTYQNFEIIAVNDGSKDHSLEILKQIDDPRLRIIDKENTGVSDTRNIAIEAAEGEYVCFLDADDYLSPRYLQRMFDVVVDKQADMVVCSYTPFRGNPSFDDKEAEMVSVQSTETLVQAGVLTSAWTKLIRLSTLYKYHIQFDKNMTFGEDLFFCWKALLASDNVWFIDEKLYGYRMTGGGATSKYHANLFEKYKAAFSELKEFGNSVGKDDEYAMDVFFTTRMPTFLRMTIQENSSIRMKKEQVKIFLQDEIITNTLDKWTQFVNRINSNQRGLYEDCREKRVNRILVRGYMMHMKQLLRGLKNIRL